MVNAVHRGHINPTLIDTGDSEASEMADQIRSHHNIMVIDTPQGKHQNVAHCRALAEANIHTPRLRRISSKYF